MGKLRKGLSFANVVSVISLVFALGLGTAWAATELAKNDVRSKHIAKRAVKRSDLAGNAVSSTKVADGSLLSQDFAAGQLRQVPQGEQGPAGPAGSPDTPQQVLEKLGGVDGPGSGVDADRLDGRTPPRTGRSSLRRRPAGTRSAWTPASARGRSSRGPNQMETTDHLTVTVNQGGVDRFGRRSRA